MAAFFLSSKSDFSSNPIDWLHLLKKTSMCLGFTCNFTILHQLIGQIVRKPIQENTAAYESDLGGITYPVMELGPSHPPQWRTSRPPHSHAVGLVSFHNLSICHPAPKYLRINAVVTSGNQNLLAMMSMSAIHARVFSASHSFFRKVLSLIIRRKFGK